MTTTSATQRAAHPAGGPPSDLVAKGTLADLALSRAVVDRAGERRRDQGWLDAAWADPATRVLAVTGGTVRAEVAESGGARLHLTSPADAPTGERYFLGAGAAGPAYFAVGVAALPEPAGTREIALRAVGDLLTPTETGLLVQAVGLDNWHRVNTHCPRCGAPTAVESGGHTRRCPVDGSEQYPRTDAAVIMAVVDADDRLLLGHQAVWPERRFSTLAGFVEPGESLERAVAREVHEESGITITSATYLGSQPWPMPASLMLGFIARAGDTGIEVDHDEIAEARWFTRAELAAAVESQEVLLPPPISIARRLIEHWYGGPLDDRGASVWR